MKTKRNKLFAVYGLLLDNILNIYQIPKPRNKIKKKLHIAFKNGKGIYSLTQLSNEDLSIYINEILNYFAVELGLYLKAYDEPENVSNLSLSEYFKIMESLEKEKMLRKLYDIYNMDDFKNRKKFLCDLIDIPYQSIIDTNNKRLINEILLWLNEK